ncbi:MAG: serine hydrolase [Lachnospiraceae bacterium]|nr:serine hydrolase [Lachnospiraceae bacterium]
MRRCLAGFTAFMLTITSVFYGGAVADAAGYHEYDVEKYIMSQLPAANIPGVSISIVSDQKEIYSATFGVDGETASDYVLGNLTQSITALAVLRLAEDEEIELEDDIYDYLPKYSALKGTTIEQLLHQTTGITNDTTLDKVTIKGISGVYQNAYVNYSILGELIETVSGETYEEYITENILDSCEMSSTYSLRQNPELQGELSPAYRTYFGYPVVKKYKYDENDPWISVSSGYLLSDVKDMGNYLQMYLKEGDEVVRPESIAGVLQNTVPITEQSKEDSLYGTTESYGMGWVSTEYKGEELYYQSGVLEDQMTMMFLIPDKKVGVVMLFNGGDMLVGKQLMETVCVGVTDIILGETPKKVDSKTYLLQHGIIDLVLLIALLGACMPFFLTGVWTKRASRGFQPVRLVKDVLIQIALPTVLLLFISKNMYPWSLMFRIVPDVSMVLFAVIVILYLGGLLKLIRSVILVAFYNLDPDGFREKVEREAEEDEMDEEDEQYKPGELVEIEPLQYEELPSNLTPEQPQATGVAPGQPQATGVTPGQPQATGVTPGQPQATGVAPGQPQATGVAPGQAVQQPQNNQQPTVSQSVNQPPEK